MMALSVWAAWYSYSFPYSFSNIEQNWPITLTMIFGSFIAGATSEGGGAIAFPVFTKVLNISPLDAKVFSLAIQSIGMMAATLTIIVMRVTVEWRLVFWASFGGLFGVALGSMVIAPLMPPALLKMLFTAMIVSFALTLALLNWKQRLYNQSLPVFSWREKLIVVLTGFLGGIMTGLVGNGIDIICFSVMVLLFRLSEKVSTPTSVVLMAFNSLAGFALHLFVIGGFTSQVENYWLAAIPVVVVGAPLGAYFCTRLNNKTIASLLITLIMIELISSLSLIPLTGMIVSISLAVFLLFSFIYYRMSGITRYRPHKGES
ncbi:MAG: sulfite exporter TauE/SafE family protein [Methylococcales bacterium]|nr:sulfite exporter TauE/SafE family protein [Methylococcales bacterium]